MKSGTILAALALTIVVFAGSLTATWLVPPPTSASQKHADTDSEPATPTIGPGVSPLVDANVRYGDQPAQRLDIHFPPAGALREGVVVIRIPDTGWDGGGRDLELYEMTLVSDGFTVISMDYQQPSDGLFPAQLADVRTVVRFARSNPARFGDGPVRIGVIGHGFGAYLGSLAGLTSDDFKAPGAAPSRVSSQVDAVVHMLGPTDVRPLGGETGGFESPDAGEYRSYFSSAPVNSSVWAGRSPLSHASENDPPFLFIQDATSQRAYPGHLQRLHQSLTVEGVSSGVVTLEDLSAPESPDRSRAARRIRAFFTETLLLESVPGS